MSTTLTPATPATFPATISGPSDAAACNAASVNTPFQSLVNGVEASRLMVARGLNAKPRLRSVNGTTVVMTGPTAMTVTVGGVWQTKAVGTQTFAEADREAAGTIDPSTVYYMYLYLSAGTVTKQISTTEPDASNFFKSGSTDYAYVGSFVVWSTGEIIAFTAANGVYQLMPSIATTTFAADAGPTTLNLWTLPAVPKSSQLAALSLRGSYSTSNTANISLTFEPFDSTHADLNASIVHLQHKVYDGAGASSNVQDQGHPFWVHLDASGRVKYTASATTYDATAWVVAYQEH